MTQYNIRFGNIPGAIIDHLCVFAENVDDAMTEATAVAKTYFAGPGTLAVEVENANDEEDCLERFYTPAPAVVEDPRLAA